MADNSTPNIVWGPSPPPSAPPPPPAAPQIVWGTAPTAPSAPTPGATSSIGAGLGAGFGESMLGIQQLLGKTLSTSVRSPISSAGNWLQKNAAQGITNLQQQEAPYQSAHPNLTGAGQFGGEMGAAVAPEGLVGDIAPAASWLGRGGQAIKQGVISGAEQYVPGSDYWKQKAKETAANIGGSVAGQQFFEGLGGVGKFMARNNPAAAAHAAVRKITETIAKGEKVGNSSAKDIIDLLNTSHAAGVPMTLMEAGGPNIQALAGHIARTPGAPRAIIQGSFKDRLQGATTRLAASIKKNFNAPDTRRAVQQALTESQRAASAPAYAKAFKPGSMAPLKKQFEKAFYDVSRARKQAEQESNVAEQRVTQAAAKVSRAKMNVYSNSAALREMRAAEADAVAAGSKVDSVKHEHASILTQLRAAQQAEANGERGGVWSPHISRMMQNPRLQEGIRRGMRIQRDEADAQNIPFDPTEYAVKLDAKGEPTVFKTPNMRLLDAGKRGLDDMLEDYRDKVTGRLNLDEQGKAIDQLRRAWIDELDRVNPDYSAARAAYAGPAASKSAMLQGQNILKTHPEDVEQIFNRMTPAEQEHYRIGAAQAYMDQISNFGLKANEVRKISEDDEMASARKRLQPIFKNKSQLDDFLASVTGERAILNAKQSIIGNSATAERMAEDATHNAQPYLDAAKIAANAKIGHAAGALSAISRLVSHIKPGEKESVKTEIARLLSDPNIKLSSVPGEVLPMPAPLPPGKFTSAALASSPIGRALGAQAGGSLESLISGQ